MLLEPRARACVECGSLIGEGQSAHPNGIEQIAQAPNVIRLEETRTSRSFEARFTDNAVENLSGTLGAYFGMGIFEARRTRSQSNRMIVGGQVAEQLPLVSANEAEILDVTPLPRETVSSHSDESVDDRTRLHRIFRHEDDKLRLKDSRIKADSKGEFVARLTCSFLYAHELEGRAGVPRTALNAMLKEATVYDGNARHWIATTADLMLDGDMIGLTVPGKERAIDTLKRIADPNVTGRFVLGASTRSRSARTNEAKGEGQVSNVKTGKVRTSLDSKKINPWVEKWKSTGIAVDAYEALQGKSNAEKGLFGLWAVRRALGDNGKVVTRVQLSQFLYQAFEVRINDATLASALKAKDMESLAFNLGGTRFQITPAGMAYIERMLGLKFDSTGSTVVSANGSAPISS